MPDRAKAALEWFEKGKHDLEGAQLLFQSGHYTDTVAVLIQQAVEKYLKGFLIHHGWRLEKIHDLVRLLAEAAKYEPTLARFEEDCRRITQYYFEGRYPGRMPTEYPPDEIRKALGAAEEVIKQIRETVQMM